MRKRIGILFFLLVAIGAGNAQDLNTPDQYPYFYGCSDAVDNTAKRRCSDHNLTTYIKQNLEYPASAKAEGTEGTVMVSFIVNTDGGIEQPEVMYDIGYGCGDEALRVVRNMPTWEPARLEGAPVPVRLEIPIVFSLLNSEPQARLFWGKLHRDTLTVSELSELIDEQILVRDAYGNELYPNELAIIYERNGKQQEATSRGNMSRNVQRLLQRVRGDSELLVQAMVQQDGAFFPVQRKLLIVP